MKKIDMLQESPKDFYQVALRLNEVIGAVNELLEDGGYIDLPEKIVEIGYVDTHIPVLGMSDFAYLKSGLTICEELMSQSLEELSFKAEEAMFTDTLASQHTKQQSLYDVNVRNERLEQLEVVVQACKRVARGSAYPDTEDPVLVYSRELSRLKEML